MESQITLSAKEVQFFEDYKKDVIMKFLKSCLEKEEYTNIEKIEKKIETLKRQFLEYKKNHYYNGYYLLSEYEYVCDMKANLKKKKFFVKSEHRFEKYHAIIEDDLKIRKLLDEVDILDPHSDVDDVCLKLYCYADVPFMYPKLKEKFVTYVRNKHKKQEADITLDNFLMGK